MEWKGQPVALTALVLNKRDLTMADAKRFFELIDHYNTSDVAGQAETEAVILGQFRPCPYVVEYCRIIWEK